MSQPLRLDQVQQQDRVVIGEAPERIVEVAKHFARIGMPAPGQVVGQLVQSADPRRQRRQRDVPVHGGDSRIIIANP